MNNHIPTPKVPETELPVKPQWSAPKLEVLNTSVIKQEEEELMNLLTNDANFKLLTGSIVNN